MSDLRSPDWMTESIARGNCPKCGYRGFVIGPQGGMSINIECGNVKCRERYNAAFYSGDVVFCERIGNGKVDIPWPSDPDRFGDHVTGGDEAGQT